jgi:WD40 repeat protein
VASRTVIAVPGLGGAVDWSRKGLFVTEGPEDTGIVDIRDASTGESVRRFIGHDTDLNDVAFSPDGTMLATTGDDGALRVWDPATGDLIMEKKTGKAGVWGPSFDADGSPIASAWMGQGTVRVMDPSTGRVVRTLSGLPNPSRTALSPDGRRLALTTDGEVVVIDLETGEEAFDLPESGESPDVAWSPDGRYIAAANPTAGGRVWDAVTGELRFALAGRSDEVQRVAWSPDSSRLATGGVDGVATPWQIGKRGTRQLL